MSHESSHLLPQGNDDQIGKYDPPEAETKGEGCSR